MIIAGDYNIYPRDLEEALYEHPTVIDVAVVGVPLPDGRTEIRAFVVSRPGERVSEAEVFAFLRERLNLPVMPENIEFREALPRSFIVNCCAGGWSKRCCSGSSKISSGQTSFC